MVVIGWLVGFGSSGARRGEYLSSPVHFYPTLDCPAEELFLLYLCKEVRAPWRMHCARLGPWAQSRECSLELHKGKFNICLEIVRMLF